MNLSNILNNFTKQKENQQPKQDYNFSKNYYPQEAIQDDKPNNQSQQGGLAGLDIQTLLPLIANLNSKSDSNPLGILSKSSGQNPLSSLASILTNKKENKSQNLDFNKNSQLKVENYIKISDLDD